MLQGSKSLASISDSVRHAIAEQEAAEAAENEPRHTKKKADEAVAGAADMTMQRSLSVRKLEVPPLDEPEQMETSCAKLWNLYKEIYHMASARDPLLAAMRGDNRFEGVADCSRRAHDAYYAALRTAQHTLEEEIETADLNDIDRENHAFLRVYLRTELLMEDVSYCIPTTSLFGPHLYLLQLANASIQTTTDANRMLRRLHGVARQCTQLIEAFDEGVRRRLTLPRCATRALVDQLAPHAVEDQASVPLYQALARRMAAVGVAPRLLLGALNDSVRAGYRALIRFLEQRYEPRDDVGIWAWPDGDRMYRKCIAYYTSLDTLTPEAVHELGCREVSRIVKQLDILRERVGESHGSLAQFIARLRADARFTPADATDVVRRYVGILAAAEQRMRRLFRTFPRAKLQVREVEASRAASAPAAHYYPPAPANATKTAAAATTNRSGIFYANTHDPTGPRQRTYAMESTALHEGVPGHHMQIALAAELYGLPRLRRQSQFFVIAFIEGYGLYAEWLGERMGFYKDAYDRIGRLLVELMRAARLVVDSGLHAMQWSRDKAVRYFSAHTAMDAYDVEAEIDRYLMMPGQALAYKIGELALKAAAERAQLALGERFTWQRFHEVVLCSGAVPLSMLDAHVDAWIAEAQRRADPTRGDAVDGAALSAREAAVADAEASARALEREATRREIKAVQRSLALSAKEQELAVREALSNEELAYHASKNWTELNKDSPIVKAISRRESKVRFEEKA